MDPVTALASAPAGANVPGSALGVARVSHDGAVKVLVDGAAEPIECRSVTMVNDGDRVRVSTVDGSLTVTGNLSERATDARTFRRAMDSIEVAVNCVVQTDEGVVIGNMGPDGAWRGTRALVGNDSFDLIGQDGDLLASYAYDGISVGTFGVSSNSILGSDGDADGSEEYTNIFSTIGALRISSSKIHEKPPGTAGSWFRNAEIIVGSGSVSMQCNRMVDGNFNGDHNRFWMDRDGFYFEGNVYFNGVKQG